MTDRTTANETVAGASAGDDDVTDGRPIDGVSETTTTTTASHPAGKNGAAKAARERRLG